MILVAVGVFGCAAPPQKIKQTGPQASADVSAIKAQIQTTGAVIDGKVNPVLKGFMQEVQGSINSRVTGMGQWALCVVVGMFVASDCFQTWVGAKNQCRA